MKMKKMMFLVACLLTISLSADSFAQPEVFPWGSMNGIRVNGHLYRTLTSIRLYDMQGTEIAKTRHYSVSPNFKRVDNRQITTSVMDGLTFIQTFGEIGKGEAEISIEVPQQNASSKAYFCVELGKEYLNENAVISSSGRQTAIYRLAPTSGAVDTATIVKAEGNTLEIRNGKKLLGISADFTTEISLRRDYSEIGDYAGETGYRFYFELPRYSETSVRRITIKVNGAADETPVELTLNTGKPGRVFEGMGGNFRLQFPETDSTIIRYCLDNLNVKWGRIAMWWEHWQPKEDSNPVEEAISGRLNERFYEQIKIARQLKKKGLRLIASAWYPPEWARLSVPRRSGTYGDPLNPDKWNKIAQSITSYLLYLKENYGIEPELFSFNEPDIGMAAAQNPYELSALTKILGRSFASAGLLTKLLLPDASNGTPYAQEYVKAIQMDNEARSYVGAIGFHTWGGHENENLLKWANAARELQLPLMITESGMDSEAHQNPGLFVEPSYQFQEISLYTRLCAYAQPSTIMQWQLTSDYSLLSGGGIYNNNRPLEPTQRFYNFKQMSLTYPNSFSLPVSTQAENINCAAFGDLVNSRYVVHIVNNDARRKAVLKGLPEDVKTLKLLVTNSEKKMEETKSVKVINGRAEFTLHEASFTTVLAN